PPAARQPARRGWNGRAPPAVAPGARADPRSQRGPAGQWEVRGNRCLLAPRRPGTLPDRPRGAPRDYVPKGGRAPGPAFGEEPRRSNGLSTERALPHANERPP